MGEHETEIRCAADDVSNLTAVKRFTCALESLIRGIIIRDVSGTHVMCHNSQSVLFARVSVVSSR